MTTSISGTGGITFPDGSVQPAAASPYTLKNKIINGDFRIDQRNAGASVTPTASGYTLDRWRAAITQASKFSTQQSTDAASGFVNSLLITSLSAYSILATDIFSFQQRIEGYNTSDLAWGTANAQTVTLSFWVKSSLTGTFGGALQNSAGNRCYPFTYSISSANTWEQKSITIAGDTTGTWLTTNGIGIIISIGLGVGSTYSGTAGAWAGTTYNSATGATSVVGTNGATFYITGVQLEIGSSATPFERRLYNQELANCQRYYYRNTANAVYSILSSTAIGGSGTICDVLIQVPVTMRTYPTTLETSNIALQDTVTLYSSGTWTINTSLYSNQIPSVRYTHGSSALTQYRPYYISANNNSAAYLGLGAEL